MPVPFNLPPPGPTGTGWGYFICAFQGIHNEQNYLSFFPFTPDSDPAMGTTPEVFIDDFGRTLAFGWNPVLTDAELCTTIGMYWKTSLGLQFALYQDVITPYVVGSVPGDYWPAPIALCVTKRSASMPRRRGRLWFPNIPRAFSTRGVNLSPGATLLYAGVASTLLTSWVSQGVTFRHGCYVKSANAVEALTEVQTNPRLGMLMRRSTHRNRAGGIFISGQHWDY